MAESAFGEAPGSQSSKTKNAFSIKNTAFRRSFVEMTLACGCRVLLLLLKEAGIRGKEEKSTKSKRMVALLRNVQIQNHSKYKYA